MIGLFFVQFQSYLNLSYVTESLRVSSFFAGGAETSQGDTGEDADNGDDY